MPLIGKVGKWRLTGAGGLVSNGDDWVGSGRSAKRPISVFRCLLMRSLKRPFRSSFSLRHVLSKLMEMGKSCCSSLWGPYGEVSDRVWGQTAKPL